MGERVPLVPGTILWMAPFYNRSGFGVGARTIVSTLHKAGIRIRIIPVNQVEPGIDDCDLALIKSLESTPLIPPITFIIAHLPSKGLLDIKLPEPNVRILATTIFDLSADPGPVQSEMLAVCKAMDQVWLHIGEEREAFLAAGFPPEKVQHVPWPHHWLENPLLPPARPETLGTDKPFRFLNISLFLPRRRWDTLIEAYLEEFRQTDNVELYLKVNYPFWHPVPGKPRQDLLDLIASLRKKTRSEAPVIVDEELGARTDILHLIDSCNAFVSTDTAPTAPLSEARARRRMVIIPDGFNLGEIGITIPVDPDAEKIPLTQEMLLYEPNHKGGAITRLHLHDVRSAMRRAYAMSVDERQAIASKASRIPGPSDSLPHIINAINQAWDRKTSTLLRSSNPKLEQSHMITSAPASREDRKFKPGISAIVHTLNEEKKIEGALQSLKGWVDEIIVCDMHSDDKTVEIALKNSARVIYHDRVDNFDVARNFSALHAGHEWVFYLDADERVSPRLGAVIRRLIDNNPDFDALGIPMDDHWYGRKLHIYEAQWPLYKNAQLLRNGRFRFPGGVHLPVIIDGTIKALDIKPAERDLAMAHYPWDSIQHWITKMNKYTNGEAEKLDAEGARFRWKEAVSEFVNDFINWYHPRGHEDGALGFTVCFNFANYAFYKKAKLFERHLLNNDLQPGEEEGPRSFVELFEYMLEVAREREGEIKGVPDSVPAAGNTTVEALEVPGAKHCPAPAAGSSKNSLPSVLWEGSQFVRHSLAGINRELCLQLLGRGVELSVIPYEPDEFIPENGSKLARISECINAPVCGDSIVHVRHKWPPNFETPSHDGHLVLIQPWEYGRIPADWVEPMSTVVDEIWTPSRHVLKSFISSGVPADRVRVIPNGIDPDLFHPDAVSHPVPTGRKFTFLFVGGTIWRKGVDLLLEAYCRSFRKEDDVALVIKDMGQNSFYKGQGVGEAIRRLQNDPGAPELVYLTDMMEEKDMPGLFTACDCLVHPYRGEGFGLPVLEAMACGVPVITTEGGATDDFCAPEEVFLIPSQRREFTMKEVKLAGGAGWVLEPDVNALRSLMREAFEKRTQAKQRALKVSGRVRRDYSWRAVANRVMERMELLSSMPVRRNGRS